MDSSEQGIFNVLMAFPVEYESMEVRMRGTTFDAAIRKVESMPVSALDWLCGQLHTRLIDVVANEFGGVDIMVRDARVNPADIDAPFDMVPDSTEEVAFGV